MKSTVRVLVFGVILLAMSCHFSWAEEAVPPGAPSGPAAQTAPRSTGVMPFSGEPDTYQRHEERIFPLFRDKLKLEEGERELPPPFGVMVVTNWMDSDWKFKSAAVTVGGAPSISLDAAQNATMDLKIRTNGVKADLWVLPFLDLMIGVGKVDVDVQLGLRDIPLHFDAGLGGGTWVRGDAIVPMKFEGDYYSFGGVLAGAYKRFYGAADFSWIKTKLNGEASLSADGFWTFTAAPKIGYNAGLSQIYIGARYISKNEHYKGTVPLPSGRDLSFDVNVETASWVGNFGIRTVIRRHWEILMESAMGKRYQITGGVGYRW